MPTPIAGLIDCRIRLPATEKTRGKKTEEEIKADKERLAEIRKERLRLAREQAVRRVYHV